MRLVLRDLGACLNKKKILSYSILFLVLYFFSKFISENRSILENFKSIDLSNFILFLLFNLLNMLIRTYINIYLFRSLDVSLQFKEAFELVYKNTIGNLIGPLKAGSGYKLHYINKHYKVPASQYISLNTAYSLLSLVLNLFILFISLIIVRDFNYFNKYYFLFIFIGLLMSLFIFYKILIIVGRNTKIEILKSFSSGFVSMFKHTWNFTFLATVTFLFILLNIFTLFIAFRIFDFNVTLLNSTIYSSIGSFTSIAKVTPGNIGLYEFLMISSNALHGVNVEEILVSSIFLRAISYLLLFLLYLLSRIRYLFQRAK